MALTTAQFLPIDPLITQRNWGKTAIALSSNNEHHLTLYYKNKNGERALFGPKPSSIDSTKCAIFFVRYGNIKRKKQYCTNDNDGRCLFFEENQLYPVNSSDSHFLTFFNKTSPQESLINTLARYIYTIRQEMYHVLNPKTNSNKYYCAIVGYEKEQAKIVLCDQIYLLHRGPMTAVDYRDYSKEHSSLTTINITASSITRNTGFFYASGYYNVSSPITKGYIAFKNNGAAGYSCSYFQSGKALHNKFDNSSFNTSSYQFAALQKNYGNNQHYKELSYSEIPNGKDDDNVGTDTSPTTPGGSISIDTNPSSGRSSRTLQYIDDLNTYTLKFVPCKDSRTGIEALSLDFFKNNKVTIKLQNDAQTNYKESNGIKYYEGDNHNTIYAVVPSENFLPQTATIDKEATKTFSTSLVNEIEIEEMAAVLDNFYHLQVGKEAKVEPFGVDGSSNGGGKSLPGLVYNTITKKNRRIERKSLQYVQKRMPKMACLIVEKNFYNNNLDKKYTLESLELRQNAILFSDYFTLSPEEKNNYQFLYCNITVKEQDKADEYGNKINYVIDDFMKNGYSFVSFLQKISPYLKRDLGKDYSVTLSVNQERGKINLYDLCLMEAYTRGHDIIQDDFTTVRAKEKDPTKPQSETSRLMDFDDNYFTYKYTGREIDIFQNQSENERFLLNNEVPCRLIHEKDLLLEPDVTLGETYAYQKYFIQAIKYPELKRNTAIDTSKWEETGRFLYKDTFKVKNFLKAIDETKYIDDDYKIITSNIDLLQCEYYDSTKATANNGWCDCSFGNDKGIATQECIYQKCGICPYRFSTEKHPRRIRTLEQSKSNRFNLIQELSKVFTVYPQFFIEYDDNGKVKLDKNGQMKKHVFFMTEKGQDKYTGFRYEKNLSNITRTVNSNALTTKMYVEGVDSELSDTGYCTIQTAPDNIGKNAYVLNFSYYTKKNLLNPEQTQRDIYGMEKGDFAFLPIIGQYNTQYDNYTQLIQTLTGQSMTILQASNDVAIVGITTALEERKKIAQKMYQFKMINSNRQNISSSLLPQNNIESEYTLSDTYVSYLNKYREQAVILWGLIEQLFFSGDYFTYISKNSDGKLVSTIYNLNNVIPTSNDSIERIIATAKPFYCKGELFWRLLIEGFEDDSVIKGYKPPFTSWLDFKTQVIDTFFYTINGDLGQYRSLYNQVKYLKIEREKILNKINDLSEIFYKKYEHYIKEGTWSDSNYLTDNKYYWAAENILNNSCKPKLSYSINVIDISPLEKYKEDYDFELGDTTYIEDIDFFDVNIKTGLPNREKVLLSEITDSLDTQNENSITVQNYSTSFNDLFEQISASVQSLTYNENTYKRASNFTAKQYIQTDSLQGTLSAGDLTLIDANEGNITLDDSGTTGLDISNNASQYKLTGEGLFFSKDGGETWDLGVGPQGFNMDYARFGQLDASKVQIIDGEYIYFLWDKNGINAYRNPATSTSGLIDFARFNKYGLSLIEKGHVRLRAGYEFKNIAFGENTNGNYQEELDLTNQNVGFYLYNDKGNPIFKTETQSEYGNTTEDYSARLSLKGEMFITNRNLSNENNNDGTIMDAVVGKSLLGGYNISSQKTYIYELFSYNALLKATSNTNYIWTANGVVSSQRIQPVYDNSSGLSTIKVRLVKYTNISDGNNETYLFRKQGQEILEYSESRKIKYPDIDIRDYILTTTGDKTNMSFEINATDLYNASGNIDIGETTWRATFSQNAILYTIFKENGNYYNVLLDSENILENYDGTANTIIADQKLKISSIGYYEKPNASRPSVPIERKNLYVYSLTLNDIPFTHWESYETSTQIVTTTSSSTATEEVGIFINNKKGVSTEAEASTNYSKAENIDNTTEKEGTVTNLFDLSDNQFVFCGDSIANGWSQMSGSGKDYAKYFIGVPSMGIWNYGTTSNNITYKYSSTQLQKIQKASYVAFNFGWNDIGYKKNEEDTQKQYAKIIKTILNIEVNRAIKKIFIVSPVGVSSGPSDVIGITRDDAIKYTQQLKNITNQIGKEVGLPIEFIDIFNNTAITSTIHGSYDERFQVMKPLFTVSLGNITSSSGNFTPEEEVIQALSGAQRLFSIILKGNTNGKTSFNNVISVLKNGCLYIGGEVKDNYGRDLPSTEMSRIPDEIRINLPTIIMSNNGTIWCNWNKFKYIDDDGRLYDRSLLDILQNIGEGIGSIDGGDDIQVAGYYIEDPIE